jgi:hypothetical protein
MIQNLTYLHAILLSLLLEMFSMPKYLPKLMHSEPTILFQGAHKSIIWLNGAKNYPETWE